MQKQWNYLSIWNEIIPIQKEDSLAAYWALYYVITEVSANVIIYITLQLQTDATLFQLSLTFNQVNVDKKSLVPFIQTSDAALAYLLVLKITL